MVYTFTCFKWIPLFEITNSYDLVYYWHNLVKSNGQADTLGFVIMPNHVHLLLHLCNDFTQYKHISAAFYETGIKHELLTILDYREV